MISWIAIVAAVLRIVAAVVQSLQNQKLIDAAVAEVILKGLRESDDAIQQAQDARKAVRDRIARDPAELRRDDGFRRD
ncbi:MAG: hypothetical protein IT562_10915 [Alphaproteobacteria bacterium]|nr:hypothetical protein [Alphaproteobacteria bacterium]